MAGKLTCKNIETTQASSVVAPAIVSSDATWTEAGNPSPGAMQYRKLPTGMVVVRILEGGYNNQVGVLPPGFRPSRTTYFPAREANTSVPTPVDIIVQSGGNVYAMYSAGGGAVDIQNHQVSFFADK